MVMAEVCVDVGRCDSCQEVLQSSGKCEICLKGVSVDGQV